MSRRPILQATRGERAEPGGDRRFTYDNPDRLSVVDVTDSGMCEFFYDGFIRRRIRREYLWQNSAWVEMGEVRYIYDGHLLLCDGNGNVTISIDSLQRPPAKYIYDLFGNLIAIGAPLAEAGVYRFSRKALPANSGIYHFDRRFYRANLQRWPNRDPIGIEGGINLYAYVGNGPINAIDTWGLAPQIAVIWIPDNGPATVQYGEPGMGLGNVPVYAWRHSWMPDKEEQAAYPFDFDWHDFSKLQITIDDTRRRLLEEGRMTAQPVFVPESGRLDYAVGDLVNLIGIGKLAGAGLAKATRPPIPVAPPVPVIPAEIVIQEGKAIATMQVHRNLANVTIGYVDRPSLMPLAHQIKSKAQEAGASTVTIDTGYVVNTDLAISLGLRAQRGEGFLGGTVKVTEGGLTPRFQITIPLKSN